MSEPVPDPTATPPLAELGGWPQVLGALTGRRDLTPVEARAAMAEILSGAATSAQIAAFIVALRMKGETTSEMGGLLDAMLAASEVVPLPSVDGVVDIVGTGGDRSHSINVSTIAALVVAGAGGRVCKHGNRAASSSCGSADLLEALGVVIDLGPEGVARCVAEAGIGFCFAPRFHASMRHAGPTRRELGVPTVFNILGPLANPARVRRYVVGVGDPTMAERMAEVLLDHGAERAFVVHGGDGLDEITITTTSNVIEVVDGQVRPLTVDPRTYDLGPARIEDLRGGDPATNARLARAVLAGDAGPHRDIVVLNAAAGLVAAGEVPDYSAGVAAARAALDSGAASDALDRLVTSSVAARTDDL
ncbi:anthranilate phosphoribosyltransferase [Iamia sp.]|uniref:anthranilate phosphoribosyltransferase n=1 Tax=Iamia sp. TaxID=2722710 RepID=UPI002BE35F54|nr:anthranilate phosphoribosyltransferase [Iamia sp.]HXH59511.1 anthranilate phosphoribosyltransferase [Iamia sp.]